MADMDTIPKRRATNKLSSRRVETAPPGRYGDGGGLWLVVDASGARRWEFLFRWRPHRGVRGAGKERQMGLGSFLQVGLADARVAAEAARNLIGKGIDPIAARRASVPAPTFGEIADRMIIDRAPELRSSKSLDRWRRLLQLPTLDDNGERVGRKLLAASAKVEAQRIAALRTLRALPIDAVLTEHVLAVLRPIWLVKPASASMMRGYFEQVINAGQARGFRSAENPARWRGHLDQLLPRPQKLSHGHHKALPFAEVPAFIQELHQRDAVAALALEFLILCASRTGEVIGMRWSEVDLGEKVWTIHAGPHKDRRGT
jgi:hypothetical protein